MPALLLAIAIVAEVAGTVALKYTDGFTNPGPSVLVVAGYGLSFWMLALVLRDMPIGLTYAVWAAVGTALIAAIGIVAFGEPATTLKLLSLGADHRRRRRPQPRRQPLGPRGDTRKRLLDAAAVVVRRDGAQALTLDAVAAEAGVSKGGLLYHFKTKRELLDAHARGLAGGVRRRDRRRPRGAPVRRTATSRPPT